jgi:hypothetical protein
LRLLGPGEVVAPKRIDQMRQRQLTRLDAQSLDDGVPRAWDQSV